MENVEIAIFYPVPRRPSLNRNEGDSAGSARVAILAVISDGIECLEVEL